MLRTNSRLVVSVLYLSVIVACGSRASVPDAGGSPTPSPSATTPPASGSATPAPSPVSSSGIVRTVTTEDSGRTVELKVGESLRVELGSDYVQPGAPANGVLERTSATGGYPTGEAMIATFRAVKAGSADLESSTDYQCLHATPSCALPQQLWSVHVVVKPR